MTLKTTWHLCIFIFASILMCGCNNNEPQDDSKTQTPEDGIYYYIKHSWGSGADKDWEWRAMNYIGNNLWKYSDKWGGVGANIHTSPDDSNAQWFPMFDNLWPIGDKVDFYYNSKSKILQSYPGGLEPNKVAKGRILISNNSSSTYQITLTGATSYNAAILSGYYIELQGVTEGSYILHYKQLDGYLIYPTEGDFKFNINKDSTQPIILN